MHGEATFVRAYEPASVLDAGCGTGRVAIELARHGIEVVGVDVDASMLATARRLAPEITWVESDLTALDLGRTFDVVVLAGNVPLFTPPGTHAALVAGVARHVAPDGLLIAGFSLDRGYGIDDWDGHATAAGLVLVERFATWDRAPWSPGGAYAVSVHRRVRVVGSVDEVLEDGGIALVRFGRSGPVHHEVGDADLLVRRSGRLPGGHRPEAAVQARPGDHEAVQRGRVAPGRGAVVVEALHLGADQRRALRCGERGSRMRSRPVRHPDVRVLDGEPHAPGTGGGDGEGHPRLLHATGLVRRRVGAEVLGR